ncbi:UNVERIFIED_CONTAM: hypothetical protein PYX00_002365 [Menopon gallinae]
MNLILSQTSVLRDVVNECLKGKEPWQIVTMTTSIVLTTVWMYKQIFQEDSLYERGKKTAFKLIRKVPAVKRKIQTELSKIEHTFNEDVAERNKNLPVFKELPENGLPVSDIVQLIDKYLQAGDYQWKDGKVSGAVYVYKEELINLLTDVYGKASYTNPLHPEIFPGICKMEAEVVRMTANLFHGGPQACGTMTTGGTESIMMAVKACRDYAIHERGIKHPQMVVPTTAHPAFDKAAAYLKIKIIHVRVDPETTAVDLKAMKRAITRNTCMLVGSVPNFPYGTMDDIVAIGALGARYNIPVHVDACLGGFVIAFMEKAGYKLPPFDFSVKGVTSISADTHKYGCAPKGSSVIMYSDKKYLHHQYTVTTDWPGGVYGSPTVNGSRAGGIIAACWATFIYFGLNGYVDITKKVVSTAKYIEEELRKIKDIFIFGTPISTVIAIGSKSFHIYRLSDALGKRGWNLNPLQYPPGIHLCVTSLHAQEGVAKSFVEDVKNEVAEIMKSPDDAVEGKMALYGMSASVPDRSIVGDLTRLFLDSMYYTDGSNIQNGDAHQKN